MVVSADTYRTQVVLLRQLVADHKWPVVRPEAVTWETPPVCRLFPVHKLVLSGQVPRDTSLILSIGAARGEAVRYLCDMAPASTVVAVEQWTDTEYQDFLEQTWAYRAQVIPIRMAADVGICQLADAGIVPAVVYCDADHMFCTLAPQLSTLTRSFPLAKIIGGDWLVTDVQLAVEAAAERLGRLLNVFEDSIWVINPAGYVVQRQRRVRNAGNGKNIRAGL